MTAHTPEECRSELRKYYCYEKMIRTLRKRYRMKDMEMTRVRTVQYDRPVSRVYRDDEKIVDLIAQKQEITDRIGSYSRRMREIRGAADAMPDRLGASLLWLHYAEGVQLKELAEDTGLSLSALTRRLQSALKEMASCWH